MPQKAVSGRDSRADKLENPSFALCRHCRAEDPSQRPVRQRWRCRGRACSAPPLVHISGPTQHTGPRVRNSNTRGTFQQNTTHSLTNAALPQRKINNCLSPIVRTVCWQFNLPSGNLINETIAGVPVYPGDHAGEGGQSRSQNGCPTNACGLTGESRHEQFYFVRRIRQPLCLSASRRLVRKGQRVSRTTPRACHASGSDGCRYLSDFASSGRGKHHGNPVRIDRFLAAA